MGSSKALLIFWILYVTGIVLYAGLLWLWAIRLAQEEQEQKEADAHKGNDA